MGKSVFWKCILLMVGVVLFVLWLSGGELNIYKQSSQLEPQPQQQSPQPILQSPQPQLQSPQPQLQSPQLILQSPQLQPQILKTPRPKVPCDNGDSTLTEDDIVIGVLTSSQPNFQGRVPDILSTWGSDWKKEQIIFFTDKEDNPFNSRKCYDVNGLPCNIDYGTGLCCKTTYLLRYFYEHYPTKKWFLRLSDDAYVEKENLLHYLSTLNHCNPEYIGHRFYLQFHGNLPSGHSIHGGGTRVCYCEGAAVILSRHSLERVVENGFDWFTRECGAKPFDDVILGMLITQMGLPSCRHTGEELFFQQGCPLNIWRNDGYCKAKARFLPITCHQNPIKDVRNVVHRPDIKC